LKVAVFGTGYVGLVTGTCLAEVGHTVVCVDNDADKINGINSGRIPIFEPGLESLVYANCDAGRLTFTTDARAAIENSAYLFIAVGTPPDEDGSADMKYVLEVAKTIGDHLNHDALIINKSTVPVGTAERVMYAVAAALESKGMQEVDFDVVSNPEFLKEGDAVNDCLRPDRIIVGTSKPEAVEKMRKLYAPLNRNHERIVVMDQRSAELTKYAANAMLATKISFMNEISNIAEQVGADVEMVRQGIGTDPRIGWHFIYPGAGYGGSCFPKDVQALHHTAAQHGYDARLLNAVEAINETQKGKLFELIVRHFGSDLSGLTFAVWGLAFKPNTDDMRAAPSRTLIDLLLLAGAIVRAYDPEANHEASHVFGERKEIVLCDSAASALEGADSLVVVTEWKQFRSPDFSLLADKLSRSAIFDGRNLYDPMTVEAAGIAYYGIGRGRSLMKPPRS
jgi:UDPglucose 6-dehydrogenase